MNQKLFFYSVTLFVLLFAAISFGFISGLLEQKDLTAKIEQERSQGELVAASCERVLDKDRVQMESSTSSKIRSFLQECKEINRLQH